MFVVSFVSSQDITFIKNVSLVNDTLQITYETINYNITINNITNVTNFITNVTNNTFFNSSFFNNSINFSKVNIIESNFTNITNEIINNISLIKIGVINSFANVIDRINLLNISNFNLTTTTCSGNCSSSESITSGWKMFIIFHFFLFILVSCIITLFLFILTKKKAVSDE